MSQIDAMKHNRGRVKVLEILSPEHPNAVDFVLLRRCLANFGYPVSEHTLQSYLVYLEERGCVVITRNKDKQILFAIITAKGLDILDGRIAEQGIDID